jgi:hypothetical protein
VRVWPALKGFVVSLILGLCFRLVRHDAWGWKVAAELEVLAATGTGLGSTLNPRKL